MKVHERHSNFVAPFVVLGVALRRGLEAARLLYWRHVFGWEIGRGVRVHWSVIIMKRLRVRLADNVVIGKNVEVWSEVCDAELIIGKGTDIARDSMIDASGGVTIGSNVTVSEGAVIYTHSHGREPRSAPIYLPLAIGNNVWICTRALVLATAGRIGDGAILGPQTVVRRPVAAGAMVKSGDGTTVAVPRAAAA